jgi:hypothetical protein
MILVGDHQRRDKSMCKTFEDVNNQVYYRTCGHAVAGISRKQAFHEVQAAVRHVLELLVRKRRLHASRVFVTDPSTMETIQQHVLTSLVWMARYTSSTVLPKKGGEPESSM